MTSSEPPRGEEEDGADGYHNDEGRRKKSEFSQTGECR